MRKNGKLTTKMWKNRQWMRCQLKASVTIARLTQLKERKLNQLRLKKKKKTKNRRNQIDTKLTNSLMNMNRNSMSTAETSLDPTLTTYDHCAGNQIKQRVNNVVT